MKVATLFHDRSVELCLSAVFEANGLEVSHHPDILSLLSCVRREGVDAALVEDDPRQLQAWMAALLEHGASPCPTVIVGQADPEGIARALRCGAADYAAISEGPHGIAARLCAQVRLRHERRGPLRVGSFTLDARSQTLSLGEQTVVLTRREFGMLRLLARHVGRVVNLRMLADEVWGRPVEFAKRSIEQHAYRLRRKLDDGFHVQDGRLHIRAVYGVGYRLET